MQCDFLADASVVCGSLEVDTEDPHSMTNPVVLVEVLSPTTAEYDLTDKLDEYHLLGAIGCELDVDEVYRDPLEPSAT